MKDQFGNDIYVNTTENNIDRNNKIYNESDMNHILVGIFETEIQASNVIHRLKEIGYSEKEITIVAKDKAKLHRLETDPHNMSLGAAIGGTLGGLAVALPALGVVAIPGIGPILAAGPIAVILGGIVAGGVAGGLIGALTELGVNEIDAKDYENQIELGKIIILVEPKDDLRDEVITTYRQNCSLAHPESPNFRL